LTGKGKKAKVVYVTTNAMQALNAKPITFGITGEELT
jgi:hypothetical protein